MQLSEAPPTPRQTVFVGGPGRSGTSFVADRLGRHPDICTLPDVELKLFTEKNGLLDLQHSLVDAYSPNRATVAVDQFRKLFTALVDGRFGQPALQSLAPRRMWLAPLEAFLESLAQDGHAAPARRDVFCSNARDLLWRIAEIAALLKSTERQSEIFLEKTPHALLSMEFLAELSPGARFIHVMRDPRAIAFSLRRMNWGPDTLTECCAWVAHYCEAWLATQSRAARSGLMPITITIEGIASEPEIFSERICLALGITPAKSLFQNADLETLNRWQAQCDASEWALLDARLAAWAHHLGYPAALVMASEEPATASSG